MNNYVMLEMGKKLLLESVYEMYVDNEIDCLKNEELFGLDKWKEFRLSVSGGDRSSMGSIGMGSIKGFLYEIELFDDMMMDWGGMYRGDMRWECRDGLFSILDEVIEDVEFRDSVKDGYNKWFEFNDEDRSFR